MNAHTSGPWIVHQRPSAPPEYGHYVTTHDGLTVCNVSYQLPAVIDGQVVEAARIANARLIAAAPELLRAAESAYQVLANIFHEWPGRHTMAGQGLLVNLRDGIAKATGKSDREVQDGVKHINQNGEQS